jgi:ABC-2 type transport system permease protein
VSVYLTLARATLAGQTAYRTSFTIQLVSAGLVIMVDFLEVLAIFTQVPTIGGFSFAEVFLLFGLSSVAFSLADVAVGSVDGLSQDVRSGAFQVRLLRPLSTLWQTAVGELQLRRIGRLVVAVATLAIGLSQVDVDWTPSRLGMLVLGPLSGTVVFGSLFVVSGAIAFWLVDGTEVGSSITYGSGYLSQWPIGILGPVLGRVFTFVVPAAFTAYLPAVEILGRDVPFGLPSWLPWLIPVMALWSALASGLVWQAGVRHYTGAGG